MGEYKGDSSADDGLGHDQPGDYERGQAPERESMTCPHCGATYEPGSRFCQVCGSTLSDSTAPTQGSEPTPATPAAPGKESAASSGSAPAAAAGASTQPSEPSASADRAATAAIPTTASAPAAPESAASAGVEPVAEPTANVAAESAAYAPAASEQASAPSVPATPAVPVLASAPATAPDSYASAQPVSSAQPALSAQPAPGAWAPQGSPVMNAAPAGGPAPLMVAEVQPMLGDKLQTVWYTKKGRFAWIASVIAVIVVVTLALVVPNIQAIAISLGLTPQNPLAVTMLSMRDLPKASSANMSFNLKGPSGEELFKLDGYYALGENTDKSVVDFTLSVEGDKVRALWDKGGFYIGSDDDYNYTYINADDVHNDLRGSEFNCLPAKTDAATCYDGASLYEFEQAIVKDGHWNTAAAIRALQKQSDKLKKQHASLLRHSTDNDKYTQAQMNTINKQWGLSLSRFFIKTLEKKDVKDAVFPNTTSVKEGDGTRLDYSIDFEQIVRAFSQHMLDTRKTYPELSNYLNDIFRSFGQSYRELFEAGVDFQMPKSVGLRQLQVSLEMDGNKALKSISYKAKNAFSLDFAVSKVNRVKVDTADLDSFVSKAQKGESLQESLTNPWRSKLRSPLDRYSDGDWDDLDDWGDSKDSKGFGDWDDIDNPNSSDSGKSDSGKSDSDDSDDSDDLDGFDFSDDGVHAQPSRALVQRLE
ncbi:hypothetical protein KIM372_01330 [Bombiscardovia nodaiensis]|uniref:Zinc-ribbon domain-containing protein n=1 Tax=Bombiscardovia nodaiensis TaxID=2932181 RepID=A0ABN6S7L7_9BIFI|nr:hypothetical protein KIM372_01330 [Bombiscardovia nodaiensis]